MIMKADTITVTVGLRCCSQRNHGGGGDVKFGKQLALLLLCLANKLWTWLNQTADLYERDWASFNKSKKQNKTKNSSRTFRLTVSNSVCEYVKTVEIHKSQHISHIREICPCWKRLILDVFIRWWLVSCVCGGRTADFCRKVTSCVVY